MNLLCVSHTIDIINYGMLKAIQAKGFNTYVTYTTEDEKCHAELTQNVCIKKLKRHLEHYTKGTLALNEKQQLSEKTSEATARAKMLDTYNNPSTTIYKMIELLESL